MSEPNEIIRIEYYHDPIPDNPDAYARFQKRMSRFHEEYSWWKTVVVDSVTFMELASLKMHQYVLNPFKLYEKNRDMRQWYGGCKNNLEEMLQMRFGSLPMNVVVCAHIDEDKDEQDGKIVRRVSAVGNLKQRLPAGYTEVYHHFSSRDDKGPYFAVQTQTVDPYIAVSRVHAPNPCIPHYEAIWKNWKSDKRPNLHALSYGHAGSGKSTFAATWPKPMLVFMFDPHGKDIPYMEMGDPGELEAYENGTPYRSVYERAKGG